ncbi:MAG: PHP domain-containing protein [Brachymonas sp.]|nr:PHP domain-containing protein [Brachymonas sp.]MBP9589675.1 PHP domain-containing protein [Brachymonas sp.]
MNLAHTCKADLHCHSTVSDGTLAPAALAQRAHANGVELWALTDHDEVAGIAPAAAQAARLGLPFLAGVEISVTFLDTCVHIVGLGIDETHTSLLNGLSQTRSGRISRAQAMAEQLKQAGIAGAFEGALQYAGNPELIARPHFARYLVEQGICSSVGEAFALYLKEGKPGYVPQRWAALPQAVSWITQSGGIAIMAHPARYDFSPQEEACLFDAFTQAGGQGVEVITASHSAAESQHYADLALQYGLYASCGSDFHSPGESRIDIGSIPPLPAKLTPVWTALHSRIR